MTDWALTDAEYEKEQKRIRSIINRWFDPLGLSKWQRVKLAFWREQLPAPDDQAAATTKADWKYLNATLLFCTPACNGA